MLKQEHGKLIVQACMICIQSGVRFMRNPMASDFVWWICLRMSHLQLQSYNCL